jgi:hypothetical protein
MIDYLETLASAAKPINDGDYGSLRQVRAENDFFDALDQFLTGKLDDEDGDDFAAFCLKATADERINEGMRLARWAASPVGDGSY